jgi:hypothetical protein
MWNARRHGGDVLRVAAGVLAAVIVLALPADAAELRRVVAVGEVQGAYDSLVKALQAADLIDDELRWSGGDAILVQTGDFLDDGTRVREVMDLLMRLQDEAETVGGQVVVLLGNHEALNILCIRRSVNYETYGDFADDNSPLRQVTAYDADVRWRTARAEELASETVSVGEQDRENWLVVHPPGYVEYAEAMAPSGRYGKWLRTLPAAAQIGDVVFLHGGISPELKGQSVEAINQEVRSEIEQFDRYRALMIDEGLITPLESAEEMLRVIKDEIEYLNSLPTRKVDRGRQERALRLETFQNSRDWYLVRKDGPIWFKGPGEWDEAENGATMAALLDAIGARTLVTGQSNGGPPAIEARFDGRVLLTSVGMSDDPWVRRQPAALEINDRQLTVVTPQGRAPLVIASAH